MKIICLDEVKKEKVNLEGALNVERQLMIGKADGTPAYSLRVFTVKPNGHTPYHSHPFEHLNYFISGQGILISENGDEHPVKKGDFSLVLPDEIHRFKNNSENENFVFICAVKKEYE